MPDEPRPQPPEQPDAGPDDTAPDDTEPDDAVPDDAVPDDAVPDDAVPDGRRVPPGSGRARDLVRTRRRPRPTPDVGGRRHHLGAVPELMPVLLPDGSAGWTRTSVVQLTAAMVSRLHALAAELEAEMRVAAADGRYEEAARSRDELEAVRAELARRGEAGPAEGG